MDLRKQLWATPYQGGQSDELVSEVDDDEVSDVELGSALSAASATGPGTVTFGKAEMIDPPTTPSLAGPTSPSAPAEHSWMSDLLGFFEGGLKQTLVFRICTYRFQ